MKKRFNYFIQDSDSAQGADSNDSKYVSKYSVLILKT
ncbi:MAG: hypothetical protein FD143_3084 [Ignavibacteria bacterium]|nr:MAG: hypothetical protein FD143_3084 [Ignavibacteria bacterium]